MSEQEQGGEGRENVEATPDIGGDDQEPGQTSHPAPDEDVGVPSEDELSEEGAGEGKSRPEE